MLNMLKDGNKVYRENVGTHMCTHGVLKQWNEEEEEEKEEKATANIP